VTSRRKEIFRDTGIYTISSYGAQLFDIVNGILIRNFLGPAYMGIWAFLQVILNYAKHSGLGVTTATARDVPYYREKGEAGRAEEVKNLVFTFTVTTALLTALGVTLFAWITHGRYPKAILYGLIVTAALLVLQRLYNLFIVLLRAHKEFMLVGALNLFSSALSVVLTILLTWKFKLYGFFASLILNYVLVLALIRARTPYRFSFFWSAKRLWPLLSLGGAILVSDILRTILTSIDRIMITKYLGFEALGIYSVALMASNYLYSLPNMIGIIFFPHFQEVYARQDRPKDLEKYLREPTLSLAYLFPCFIGLVWIFSSRLVPWLLPEYASGVPALRYLILGSFFLALTHPFSLFIITVRKHWHLVPLQGIVIGLGFAVTGFCIQRGWGIEGVAVASVLISVLFFLALSVVSLREVCGWTQVGSLYLKVFLAFSYFAVVLCLLEPPVGTQQMGILHLSLKYLTFLLLMSPLLFFLEKEAKVVSTLWEMIKDRGRRKKVSAQPEESTLKENEIAL